jgi:hypothetical protein
VASVTVDLSTEEHEYLLGCARLLGLQSVKGLMLWGARSIVRRELSTPAALAGVQADAVASIAGPGRTCGKPRRLKSC